MSKFRKKPVVIEAVQYKGNGNFDNPALPDWIWKAFEEKTLFPQQNGSDPLQIKTLEGVLTVATDDFIIKGVNGEIYPCKPDIFEKTYESVQEEEGNDERDENGQTFDQWADDNFCR